MSNEQHSVTVTPFQLKLKVFCVWIENKFECRLARAPFALRMAIAAAAFFALHRARMAGGLDSHWALGLGAGLLFGWAAFWVILQIVRRFHDMGRTGGLFWAVAIPYWASMRIADLFHLADKPEQVWLWGVLALFCLWSIWLTFRLFLKRGTEGPNGYDGRGFYQNAKIP